MRTHSFSLSHTHVHACAHARALRHTPILFCYHQALECINEFMHWYLVEWWWSNMEVLMNFTSVLMFSSMDTSSWSQRRALQLNMASVRSAVLFMMSSYYSLFWLSSIYLFVQKEFIACLSIVFGHVALAALNSAASYSLIPLPSRCIPVLIFLSEN